MTETWKLLEIYIRSNMKERHFKYNFPRVKCTVYQILRKLWNQFILKKSACVYMCMFVHTRIYKIVEKYLKNR